MLAYDIVDVFSERAFAGNQLAVVHGADDLTTDQCLAIAREFNLAETTFPATGVVDEVEYSTRIFTPEGEIPFAGHPTLGTAWVLRSRGLLSGSEVTQLCGAGRIAVRFDEARVELSAFPRDLAGPLEPDLVGALLADVGLSADDLAGPVFVAGCGLTWAHIPVVEDALARAAVSFRPLQQYLEWLVGVGELLDPFGGLNIVHLSGPAPALEVHARVFVPGGSVPEDPATGSAALGLGMALVASGVLPEGGTYDITQGVEMGRPSCLHASVDADERGGRATLCRVGGAVQPVARGEITSPG